MCVLIRLNGYGFKTHDFSTINMIIKTKQMFFNRVSEIQAVKAALFWKRDGVAAAYLHLNKDARKQYVSASTQNKHFHLWGTLN